MRTLLAIFLCLMLTACMERWSEVGRAPDMSPVGVAEQPLSANLPDSRAAIAVPERAPLPPTYALSSLWRSGPTSLFGDRRARIVGDIVTVVIEIDDSAEISNSTSRSRSGNNNLAIPDLLGLPQVADQILPAGAGLDPAVAITSSSDSSGDGAVQRNERITLRIAATVIRRLANGHLVIAGTQEVRVNSELRDLQVAGIIRPEDISRQNTITYDKIAGARISYGGRGILSDVQHPRLGQEVLDHILPF